MVKIRGSNLIVVTLSKTNGMFTYISICRFCKDNQVSYVVVTTQILSAVDITLVAPPLKLQVDI